MPEDWMKSDNVNGIDPLKLQMLNSIASQGSQKGMSELLPFWCHPYQTLKENPELFLLPQKKWTAS